MRIIFKGLVNIVLSRKSKINDYREDPLIYLCDFDSNNDCGGILNSNSSGALNSFSASVQSAIIGSTTITDVSSISEFKSLKKKRYLKSSLFTLWIFIKLFKTFLNLSHWVKREFTVISKCNVYKSYSIFIYIKAKPTSPQASGPFNDSPCRIPWYKESTINYFCLPSFQCMPYQPELNSTLYCQRGQFRVQS